MANLSLHMSSRSAVKWPATARLLDAVTLSLFALLLGLIAVFPRNVNHDAALFLETGSLILDGKQPYVDFNEINFPLVMYLHTIPVAISRVLHVNPIPVFSVLVLLLAAASAWGVRHLLTQRYQGDVPLALQVIPPFIALYSLYLFLIADYGQREYLFLLLVLPALVVRWMRWEGCAVDLRWALVTGLAAAVGTAIKPHFIPMTLAVEFYWLVSTIRRRDATAYTRIRQALLAPEAITFVAFGAGYAALLLLLPSLRQGIFEQILPYATSGYATYNYNLGASPPSLLARLDTFLIWVALAAALPLVRRNRSLVRPLWVMTLVAVLVFCLQGKGWYYHRIPANFGACVLILMLLAQRDPYNLPLIDPLLKALLAILAYAIITLGGVVLVGDYYPGLENVIEQNSRADDPVLFINSSVTPGFPLLTQTQRSPADGNLSGYPIGDDSVNDPGLTQYLVSLRQSITSRRPVIILIDTQMPCYGCGAGYGVMQYLQSIGFIDQYVTPGYRDAGTVEQYEVYLPR